MSVKLPAAKHRRPTVWDLVVAGAVVIAAGVLLYFLQPEQGNFLSASIVLDGESIAQYDLDRLTEPVILEVEEAAYPLTIEIQPGRIRIAESSCPGQDCIHTGWISQAGQQIICLPNRLVISLTGTNNSDIDAITG